MTTESGLSVNLQRRRLRGELRRVRVERNYTQKEVAEAMEWSLSKLIRIENGSVGVSISDLKELLRHYGIDDDNEVNRLVAMARAGKERPAWWDDYRASTSQQYVTYLAYENSASVIEQFEPMLIPGLLQEEGYARAVLKELADSASKQLVDDWVELRMRRQEELFERPAPPEMLFVLSEAALRPWVGGADVMRRQLLRLREIATKANVTIEIVPFRAGAHPGMKGPFVILQFADDLIEDVLFLENARGDMVSRDVAEDVEPHSEALARLRELAASENLDALIEEALKQIPP
jgi:transcriptional regulator with XRE-family HTH domain